MPAEKQKIDTSQGPSSRLLSLITIIVFAFSMLLPPASHAGGPGRPEPRRYEQKRERVRNIREVKQRELERRREALNTRLRRERLERRRNENSAEGRRRTPASGEYVAAKYRGNYAVTPTASRRAREIRDNRGRDTRGYEPSKEFHNDRGALPRNGRYREYDVHPRTGKPRGTERIVRDGRSGRTWYTRDHYRTFVEVR